LVQPLETVPKTKFELCPIPAAVFEFVSSKTAAELEQQQTFTIILPNLIHQSKKRNLKKRWKMKKAVKFF